MFQFPAFAHYISSVIRLHRTGLPHSEILGLRDICSYPKLIAACHVLLRLPKPRHPPSALLLLLYIFFIFHKIIVSCCMLIKTHIQNKISWKSNLSCSIVSNIAVFTTTIFSFSNMSKNVKPLISRQSKTCFMTLAGKTFQAVCYAEKSIPK